MRSLIHGSAMADFREWWKTASQLDDFDPAAENAR
jgi:hypothetical protein